MAKDVNTSPVVTGTGVVEPAPTASVSQVATDDGVQPAGGVTPEAAAAPAEQQAEQTEEGRIPLSRLNEVIKERDEARADVAQRDQHIALLGNQSPKQPAQASTEQAPDSLTVQVMKHMGIDMDGYATNAEMAQVYDAVSEIRSRQSTSQNNAQSFIASHPDYVQVVGTTDPAGNFIAAPPLLRAMQEDPQLAAALQAAGAGASRLAYKIAVGDPVYQKALAEQKKSDPVVAGEAAEQAIKAAAGMTSLSAAGGGGNIDKGAQFAAMTDEQIRAHGEKVMKGGGVAI